MQIKIYISFLITALFLCVPHTRAQEIEVPITLNEHGTQLRDALRKIEQQSPYLFLYNETQLDMKQKINEKITSPDIRKILDRLCGPIGIRYEIMDVQILLMPKIDTGKPKPYPVPVTGYITDEKGSPMEFVSVIDLLSGKGGLTNEEGYFRFFTDKDSCRLQISHLAYKPELRTVGPDNRHLQIQLIPAVFNLDEVVAIREGQQSHPRHQRIDRRNEYLGIFLVRYKLDTGYTDTGRRVYFGRKQAASRGRWGTRSILE